MLNHKQRTTLQSTSGEPSVNPRSNPSMLKVYAAFSRLTTSATDPDQLLKEAVAHLVSPPVGGSHAELLDLTDTTDGILLRHRGSSDPAHTAYTAYIPLPHSSGEIETNNA